MNEDTITHLGLARKRRKKYPHKYSTGLRHEHHEVLQTMPRGKRAAFIREAIIEKIDRKNRWWNQIWRRK